MEPQSSQPTQVALPNLRGAHGDERNRANTPY